MVLSLQEAAGRLGMSPRQLRYRIKEGTIAAYKVGDRWTLNERDLPGPKAETSGRAEALQAAVAQIDERREGRLGARIGVFERQPALKLQPAGDGVALGEQALPVIAEDQQIIHVALIGADPQHPKDVVIQAIQVEVSPPLAREIPDRQAQVRGQRGLPAQPTLGWL